MITATPVMPHIIEYVENSGRDRNTLRPIDCVAMGQIRLAEI